MPRSSIYKKRTAMRPAFFCCIFIAAACILCMIPQKVPAADIEYDLNGNADITIREADCYAVSGSYAWLKYKAAADGYLTLNILNPEGAAAHAKGCLALYNSSKSVPLSSKAVFYNAEYPGSPFWNKIAFGLKAGQEYYIRVAGENAVRIFGTFKKIKDKSGESRGKALELKKNKARTGLILAGESRAGWYKLQLAKTQKLRLYYTAGTRGSFKLTVYFGKQKIASRNISYASSQKKIVLYLTKQGRKTGLIPGTYYIKAEQADESFSSGFYKIKWN